MKPANFSYHRPSNLDEALKLLDTYPDEAKVIAGGQSLVPMMNMRLARPEYLIDINDLKDLSFIRKAGDWIEVGALTRQAELEASALLKEFCPIVPEAIRHVGHYAIRQRGTVGGSIAHADPSAELPLLAVLLRAQMAITSSEGTRTASAEEFFVTIYTTDLLPTELVTQVSFPVLGPKQGFSYQEFSRRAGDFALVSAGSVLTLDDEGKVVDLNLAVAGADAIPLNVRDKVASFCGEKPDENWIKSVSQAAIEGLEPDSDLHATAQDRLEWLELLIQRALKESLVRVQTRGDVR
ncbi:xanthine dehydrogenase family protein subunit M [Alicyclobacillus tolerans]|uniref:FAD binding domain-containing protein n=1 Tax=Alicyclobacillus tolerans TaxID=90970 RepID=UPI001F334F1F|nr:xanthine dehydrogenase family protein subunit M [Alicyclobacillus tolerans]MCF8565048.1 xanthine dehydrogenase family protein subunit M [Alicyclobacillus tolerans]